MAITRRSRLLAVTAASIALLLGAAGAAQAHVHVFPDATTSGGDAQLTFRVPDESDTLSTVRIVVTLPQDRPFTEVYTRPVPGWTSTVTEAPLPTPVNVAGATITKAVRTLTWTAAAGAGIGPGHYQEFAMAVDELPAPGLVTMPVDQYYSDGSVVHWNEPPAAGQPEPEHPAPSFSITAADTPSATVSPSAATSTTGSAASAPRPTQDTTTDGTARWLGGIALLVALAAVGVARVRRRPPA